MKKSDRWLPVSEVAFRIGCHPDRVRGWIDSGDLIAVKLSPRGTRVSEASLVAFLASRRAS